jgi:AGZA family xanthine/uracil permease-like MFS transporter
MLSAIAIPVAIILAPTCIISIVAMRFWARILNAPMHQRPPAVTAYIESSSGVSVGGRTGLTAVVVGLLFLLVIFLSPLAGMVPPYAAAGALIYVGVLMTSSLSRVKWDDLTEAVPAFITAVMMPFSFSITEGIALGFISYCVMKAGTGRFREISPCVIVVALLFVLKIVFIDAK